MDSCTPECTPNTNVSTTNTPRLVANKESMIKSTQSDVSIGDVASGVPFGMAVKPCLATEECEGGDGDPDVCANGCSGVLGTGCTQCECKYTLGVPFNMNHASGINAEYYDDPSLVIREYPNTINWYNGQDLSAKDVYSELNPVSNVAINPYVGKPVLTIRSDLLFSFMRIDINDYRLDAAGRRIYRRLADTTTIKYSSQVAVICHDRKTNRYYYLALSSVAGYDTPSNPTPLLKNQFLYTAWRDAWAVWRTMPFSFPDEVYGDGVWTVWDDQNTTKSMREGGTFQLQNWLLATSVDPTTTSTWDEAYTDVPSDLSDIQSRTGFLSRSEVPYSSGGDTVFNTWKTSYAYFITGSCLSIQLINSGYEGADNVGSQVPQGANRQYFGAPLMGVNKTLQDLRDHAAGITDATTCVVGIDSNDEGDGVDPGCLCTDTKQFYTWFVSSYRGCIADAPLTFPGLPSGTTTAITTRTPVWTYITMGALGLLVLIALGVIIWLVVHNARPSKGWAEPVETTEMFSMEDDTIM